MDKTVYVVSGFMRTGTSMMMKALEAGGMDVCYKQSRDEMKDKFADKSYDPNVGGLYELEREDYQKLDFPVGYQGKLIKALAMGVPRMLPMNDGIRVVFMRRDPEEIRQSFMAFFNKNIDVENLDERMEYIIRRIENRKDVKSVDVFWYRKVIESPQKYFVILREHGWDIDIEKASLVVDSKYCRYKAEDLTVGIT